MPWRSRNCVTVSDMVSIKTIVINSSPYAHRTASDECNAPIEIVYLLLRADDGV
jgi:hypothetical protein